jgi:integrase/recombinase XerD
MPTSKSRGSHLNAPEYADRVNLIKKIKVDGSWRFAPVVPEPNGRLKDKVRINGAVETHAEGAYYIEWRERGKRCRVSVAREDAVAEARKKAVKLQAIGDGLIATPDPLPATPEKTPIGDAIDDYLKYVKMQRKKRTFLTYRYTLDVLLRASYKKKFVDDATWASRPFPSASRGRAV